MAENDQQRAAAVAAVKDIKFLMSLLATSPQVDAKRLVDLEKIRESLFQDVCNDIGGEKDQDWKDGDEASRKQQLIRLSNLQSHLRRIIRSEPEDPDSPMYFAFASKRQIYWLCALSVLVTLALLCALILNWGQAIEPDAGAGEILFTVIIAGGLGGCLRLIPSFASYVGNRQLLRSWLIHYYVMPVLGAGLAPLVYLLFFSGEIGDGDPTRTDSQQLHYAVAVAALTGLFAKDGMDKLKEIYLTVFGSSTPLKDKDKDKLSAN
jgi:hypothetical protein